MAGKRSPELDVLDRRTSVPGRIEAACGLVRRPARRAPRPAQNVGGCISTLLVDVMVEQVCESRLYEVPAPAGESVPRAEDSRTEPRIRARRPPGCARTRRRAERRRRRRRRGTYPVAWFAPPRSVQLLARPPAVVDDDQFVRLRVRGRVDRGDALCERGRVVRRGDDCGQGRPWGDNVAPHVSGAHERRSARGPHPRRRRTGRRRARACRPCHRPRGR